MTLGDNETSVASLKALVRNFVNERRWEKYHNPKDVAESICIEAAELLEIFQWVSGKESLSWRNVTHKTDQIREELADVLIYCLSMANAMDIDLSEAVLKKVENNNIKYPVKEYRGIARREQ
jgi:dCTP diphosphatase